MKIAICSSEVVPFAKTGGLADVSGALPLALKKLGHEVIIIMPKYKQVVDSGFKLKKIGPDVLVSDEIGVKTYFIEHEQFFNRPCLYGEKTGDYPDNLDRFSHYSRRALELLKEINFKADVIHCHDWQSALVIIYLKNLYNKNNFYAKMKTLFTIHNIGYQGLFPKEEFPKLGLDWSLFNMETLEFYDKVNLLKGGIVFSDAINTVSVKYSKEIQTKEFGFGMEGILNKRKDALFGIINGLDYSIWSPETDKYIFKKFSLEKIEDKYSNKEGLQKLCGLPVKKGVPLFGMVSRLAAQKGLDIFAEGIEEFCKLGVQLVILGTGDIKYHMILEDIVKKYPKVISLNLKFDDSLAHKIYAGSDIFLMPSHYEPCGLGQMISMAYGTVPLVFKTGGLADTVDEKVGFVFSKYTKTELLDTIKKALAVYKKGVPWQKLITNDMQADFSWEESAQKYVKLYQKLSGK
ncbi:MAG: glycogen synthase GlgA [Candidatus Omnitrophica bacterium]|nr:glycogen synthase GlgA [Candidatus Omnitrophota bacterium]